LKMSERCENCGRFVTDQQLWHSDELGHSVCDHCEEMWVTCVDKADTVESTPIDNYADYFEDIQNGGPYNYYYSDD
jgi:hypothetical protein